MDKNSGVILGGLALVAGYLFLQSTDVEKPKAIAPPPPRASAPINVAREKPVEEEKEDEPKKEGEPEKEEKKEYQSVEEILEEFRQQEGQECIDVLLAQLNDPTAFGQRPYDALVHKLNSVPGIFRGAQQYKCGMKIKTFLDNKYGDDVETKNAVLLRVIQEKAG